MESIHQTKSEGELAQTIDKTHRWVIGWSLSMDKPCLKRFGENQKEMLQEFFKMLILDDWLEVSIVLELRPSTDWTKITTYSVTFFSKN